MIGMLLIASLSSCYRPAYEVLAHGKYTDFVVPCDSIKTFHDFGGGLFIYRGGKEEFILVDSFKVFKQ